MLQRVTVLPCQVEHDRVGIGEHDVTINQHRHLPETVTRQKLDAELLMALEIHRAQLIGLAHQAQQQLHLV